MKKLMFGAAMAALSVFTVSGPLANATPTGHLDINNCIGGGVTVTATVIDWIPPTDAGNGCIDTGVGTNVSYSTGTLTAGAAGTILDLNAATTVLPLANFMTFATAPGLSFSLSALGPGAASTTCVGLAVNQSCSVFAGSPFVLTATSNGGTAVRLDATGRAIDSTGSSIWSGSFTTQISNMTPAQIQATILAGGSVTSTHSGDFSLTTVPEPTTIGSMAFGLLLIGAGAFRRKVMR
jgi:hypothetical protein